MWKPEIIMPCISCKSGKVEENDICRKIVHKESCNFFIGNSESNVKFDPGVYYGINSFDTLKRDIIEVCRSSGFKATTDNRQYRKPKGAKLAAFQIICDHNRNAELPNGKEKIYNTTRPLHEDKRCPFQFQVFCSQVDNCWYISNTDPAKLCHKFHIQFALLEKLKIEYQKFGNSTNIMSIYYEVTESMKIEQYEEWSDIHKSMFALHNMHIQNECLIHGSEIPSKYRNTGNKTDKNDIELSEDNYIQEFPYNEEIGEEFEALYSSPVKKKGLEEFDTSIYQFLQYKNQELLNLVQGTPEAETMLRERMNEIVSDLRKMQLKNGKTNFSQESTIVSSNMKQSTTPKNHNRTKRKHEMFSQPSSWKKRPQKKNARTKRASK